MEKIVLYDSNGHGMVQKQPQGMSASSFGDFDNKYSLTLKVSLLYEFRIIGGHT